MPNTHSAAVRSPMTCLRSFSGNEKNGVSDCHAAGREATGNPAPVKRPDAGIRSHRSQSTGAAVTIALSGPVRIRQPALLHIPL